MASFFQPTGSSDPVIAACSKAGLFESSGNGTSVARMVYCNRMLTAEERLQTPLQYFILVLAVASLALPLVAWFVLHGCKKLVRVRRGCHLGYVILS